MNLKAISNFVTSKAGRQILQAQKHSPTIMFAAGVVGVVTTVVLSSRATLKLEGALDEAQSMLYKAEKLHESGHEDYSDNDYRSDVALIYVRAATKIVKLYGPSFIVGALSIASLTGSHVVLTRRNAGLVAAYAALEKGFNDYRQRVLEEVGPEKELEFRHGVQEREVLVETNDEGPQVKTMKTAKTPSIYARFFDETATNWKREPMYNQVFLRAQQNYFNDLLQSRGHVFLNEVYDALGLERSRAGAVVGWVVSKDQGDNFVDFGIFDGDRQAVRDFVNGNEGSILLDFNVDGVIYDQI